MPRSTTPLWRPEDVLALQDDIAQAIDSIGGQLDAFTAKEYAAFHLKVLDEKLPLTSADDPPNMTARIIDGKAIAAHAVHSRRRVARKFDPIRFERMKLREQRRLGWETFHLTSPKHAGAGVPEEEVDAKDTQRAIEAEGQRALLLPGDVTDPDYCEECIDRTIDVFVRPETSHASTLART